jgi:hypothetical protein
LKIGAKRLSSDASTTPLLKLVLEVVLEVSQGLPRGWAWKDSLITLSTWIKTFSPWGIL